MLDPEPFEAWWRSEEIPDDDFLDKKYCKRIWNAATFASAVRIAELETAVKYECEQKVKVTQRHAWTEPVPNSLYYQYGLCATCSDFKYNHIEFGGLGTQRQVVR
jgi:hypothetical protein